MFFAFGGCVLLGFLAGLFSFKVKDRWCPTCGQTTVLLHHQHGPRRSG